MDGAVLPVTGIKNRYYIRLASGTHWCLQGASGTERWVGQFAELLGISSTEYPSSGRTPLQEIVFKRHAGRKEEGARTATDPSPGGPLQDGCLEDEHPGIEEVCLPGSRGIMFMLRGGEGSPVEIEQMRRSLNPVLHGAVHERGLPLHAALVERDGRGYLILGASGTGKSTCCKRLQPPWRVLADDMVLVVPAAGEEFWAHPLPTWSAIRAGTVRWSCRINEGVPVRALTLLAQSESDGLEPLGSGAATIAISNAAAICFHYLDGGLETDRSRLLRKKIFENASALVKNLPVYVLRVSLAGKFWEKIEAIPDNERTGAGRLQSIARQALPG